MRRISALALLVASLSFEAAVAQTAAGGWIKAHNSRVRLSWCDGWKASPNSASVPLAFVEILLDPGWKTYWRNPGDAGVPPSATWEKSGNLSSATFAFPAPQRLSDSSGETLGYKDKLVLPVRVESKDGTKKVRLAASLSYGICANICIPVEVELVGACPDDAVSEDAKRAIDAVPRTAAQRRSGDPVLIAVSGSAAGLPPTVSVDVDFGVGAKGTDLFVEAPDGLFAPQVRPVTPDAKGRAHYTIDLAKTPDAKDLIGKELRFTMVSSQGASEAVWMVK